MEENRFPIFSKRFLMLRSIRHQSQEEFAKFLGISRPTVGFYENGIRIPDALTLRQIAEKCNVSADWLIGLSNTSTLPPKSEFPVVDRMASRFYREISSLAAMAGERDLYDALFNNAICEIFPDHIEYSVNETISRCRWVLDNIDVFRCENDCSINGSNISFFLSHGFFQDQNGDSNIL